MALEFHQQPVWPLALRLIHWVLALSMLVLVVTGWLLGSGQVLNPGLHDLLRESLHVPAGQIAGAALAGRVLLLLLDPGVAGWRALAPQPRDRAARSEMLLFYLSWGRRQPPAYFAHDPVWAMLYPVFFVLLGLQVFNGLGIHFQRIRQVTGLSLEGLSEWHGRFALLLVWFVGLHVLAVLLREIRGKGYEVSAMLHGLRIFSRDRNDAAKETGPVRITVDQLLNSGRKENR